MYIVFQGKAGCTMYAHTYMIVYVYVHLSLYIITVIHYIDVSYIYIYIHLHVCMYDSRFHRCIVRTLSVTMLAPPSFVLGHNRRRPRTRSAAGGDD